MLDIGTGGGEVLTQILHGNDCQAVAIEEWHVNAPVAAATLQGRAAVVRAAWHQLPFCSEVFDLVLSRHTAIAPDEIARVLTQPGRFITQQVGPDNWPELSEFFPDRTVYADHYREYPDRLEALGFSISRYEKYARRGRYNNPAHIAYLLTACVWEVPGFSVATHFAALMALARHMENHDGLVLTYTNYLIDATR